jgi:phosphatidylserine/phosphatidylglycerophosphate/cardiolipin synthase-like enzyme
LKESLTGLNIYVDYLHTKYLLIDPLTDDPTVISGSANFSDASTEKNDENMLVIQGNTRVADIFLTEFMRLFNHFHIRNVINQMSDEEAQRTSHLTPTDSWTTLFYEEGTQEHEQRLLFK